MQVIELPIEQITPYDNNPRINDTAVEYVAESIKEFGFQQPIVVDANNIVVAGHTRLKAAISLGLNKCPVVVATGLTEQQIAAYRLADNKTTEFSLWDFELLDVELDSLNDFAMEKFGFVDFSALDDLMTEEFSSTNDRDNFVVSLVFPKDVEESVTRYINEVGREEAAALIIEEARQWG